MTEKSGFKNWDEMLKYAKTKELKWGVGQFGRAKHCDSLVVRETLGIPARFIAWGSTAEGLNAILRGDVPVGLFSDDSVQALLDAGEIRILADFTGGGGYPGIPTSKDLGHPELAEKVGGHRFYIAPPGLPKEIGDILVPAFKKALKDQEFLAWAKKSKIPVEPIYGDDADKLGILSFTMAKQKTEIWSYPKGGSS